MKEMNELVELAKAISSRQWFLNADEEVTAVDNDAGPDDSGEVFISCAANIQLAKYISTASPENILAIAEAFRALEQRAEAAEAKLAEYEKQEPFGFCNEDAKNSDVFSATVWREREDAESRSCGLELFPLFTRPAPAVSLAELVPEQALNGQAHFLGDKEPYYNRGFNDCRATILHNIEEANK